MSRIGKRTIEVPKGVTVTLDGQTVTVKGPKGERSWTVADEIEVAQGDDGLNLTMREDNQRSRAMWGLSRTLVDNMVVGVTDGYEKKLEIVGVGYKAKVEKGKAGGSLVAPDPEHRYTLPEGADKSALNISINDVPLWRGKPHHILHTVNLYPFPYTPPHVNPSMMGCRFSTPDMITSNGAHRS